MSKLYLFFIIFSTITIVLWFSSEIALFKLCQTVCSIHPIDTHFTFDQSKQNFLLLKVSDPSQIEQEGNKAINAFRGSISSEEALPKIYIITPTYARPVQKAELTRLSHTLMLVPNIHWIVVEDSTNKTSLVTKFLTNCNISSTHLNVGTPSHEKRTATEPTWMKHRGLFQRNKALDWLREHLANAKKGVVYFADDDNTYDLAIFEEMRQTKVVSVWPVGLVGGLMVELPLVKNGMVVGWNTMWGKERKFPIDMAGFAVSLNLLLDHSKVFFNLSAPLGYLETTFLQELVTVEQLEPKADNCNKVLVWHTRTEHPPLDQEKKLKVPSNLNIEV